MITIRMEKWKLQLLLKIVRSAIDRCAGEYRCEHCRLFDSCNYLILEKELEKYEKKFDL